MPTFTWEISKKIEVLDFHKCSFHKLVSGEEIGDGSGKGLMVVGRDGQWGRVMGIGG